MATVKKRIRRNRLYTHEGAPADNIGAEAQLRRTVMACLLWEDTFYESGQSVADRIADGVASLPNSIVAKLAVEAREVMHLRHIPLLLVREMARKLSCDSWVSTTLARVIQRPDELSEFLAIYWKDGKEPLSNQVKKGLARAFTKFDPYQLAKYNRDREIKLRDVMFLTHPKPVDAEQAEIWRKLAEGTLESPDTWEVALSAGGDKKEHWTRLLTEGKLGGMALLRNLRNMQDAGVDRKLIRDGIHNSNFRRVLPFRFIAAANHAPSLEPDLEKAMFKSLEGSPKLAGKTVLVLDNSMSMNSQLSGKSNMSRRDAAGGLAILLREICEDVAVIGYGGDAKVLPSRRGFALADAYRRGPGGYTDTGGAKNLADSIGYDRVIIITDEQTGTKVGGPLPGTKGYMVNVASYRNGICYRDWTHIDGWSEGVVRYIQEFESA